MRYWLLLSLIFSLGAFACEESDSGSGTGLIGEGCVDSGDCASGPCVDPGSGMQICTQSCDDANPCPSGYECTAAGTSNVCIPGMMSTGGTEVPVGGTEMPMAGTEMPMGGTEMPMGGTEVSGPDSDCGEIVACANSCQDQSCVQACFNSASAQGQSLFNALLGCITGTVENGQCGQEDFACQNQAFGAELTACVGEQGPTQTGTLSFADLNGCFNMCGPNDLECIQGCFNNATATAQQQYGAIIMCAQGSGCAEGDNACVNNACANEPSLSR